MTAPEDFRARLRESLMGKGSVLTESVPEQAPVKRPMRFWEDGYSRNMSVQMPSSPFQYKWGTEAGNKPVNLFEMSPKKNTMKNQPKHETLQEQRVKRGNGKVEPGKHKVL